MANQKELIPFLQRFVTAQKNIWPPGGQFGFRPDRTTYVYTRILKQIYPEVPVVIAGIEASMRRKEEATKVEQLKMKYGNKVEFVLFLCGYFDSGYLGYEAGEGIDWIWDIIRLKKKQ